MWLNLRPLGAELWVLHCRCSRHGHIVALMVKARGDFIAVRHHHALFIAVRHHHALQHHMGLVSCSMQPGVPTMLRTDEAGRTQHSCRSAMPDDISCRSATS